MTLPVLLPARGRSPFSHYNANKMRKEDGSPTRILLLAALAASRLEAASPGGPPSTIS